MMYQEYRIRLTTDEQHSTPVSRGRAAAYKQTHARLMR